MRNKVYVHGAEGTGWSIDNDRSNLELAIRLSSYKISRRMRAANIIHSLWWNNFVQNVPFSKKPSQKVILTTSNFIDPQSPYFSLHDDFEQAKLLADYWVVASSKQKKIFDKLNLPSIFMPFLIDNQLFRRKNDLTKIDILKQLGIADKRLNERIVFGSFQRDSLGSDLEKAKPQKGAENLIYLLRDLPKESFILFLAGPRRHYIIKQCKRYDIPYYYFGHETDEDDIDKNIIPIKIMPLLYQACDIYLMTSNYEGGPKSIVEAASLQVPILATDTGLAPDFLHPDTIFNSLEEYKKFLLSFLSQSITMSHYTAHAHSQYRKLNSEDTRITNLRKLYKEVFS